MMKQRTRKLLWISGGTVLVAVVAVAALWFFVLRSDAPPAVSIEEAVETATSTVIETTTTTETPATTAGSTATSTTTESTAPTTAVSTDDGIVGEWAVVEGNGTFAGYRVNEELANIGVTTAAGRTEGVIATLIIEGTTVTSVEIEVDTTRLQSDSSRRDGAIRNQALETNSFPTAGFTLVEPIPLPDTAASSDPFSVDATGDLTIHGVTNRVTIPLTAALVDNTIAVVGSLDILFSDYDIDPPSAVVVLSVDDNGVMEFQLLFERD